MKTPGRAAHELMQLWGVSLLARTRRRILTERGTWQRGVCTVTRYSGNALTRARTRQAGKVCTSVLEIHNLPSKGIDFSAQRF